MSAGTTANHNTCLMSLANQKHHQYRQRRPKKRPNGIHRLTKTEAGPANRRGSDIGDQRVARGTPDTFADAIKEPCDEHRFRRGRQGKQRLGQRRHPIAQEEKPFAAAKIVADRAGEYLGNESGCFGQTLDNAHGHDTCPERGDEEHRQQAVNQLRGHIHEQAHETEHPDGSRNRRYGYGFQHGLLNAVASSEQ